MEDSAERHLRPQQREVLADADPGTPTERKETAAAPCSLVALETSAATSLILLLPLVGKNLHM